MTSHLTPDEVIAAIEGLPLDARVHEHLASCGDCQTQVAALRAVESDLHTTGSVPEPSPLFWDHFSARVRHATLEEPVVAARWWDVRRWALIAAACAVTALAVTVSLRTPAATVPQVTDAMNVAPAAIGAGSETAVSEDAQWDDVVQVAAQLSVEDVGGAASVVETANLVEDLTPQERAVFVRLLMAEMERRQ